LRHKEKNAINQIYLRLRTEKFSRIMKKEESKLKINFEAESLLGSKDLV
jgi:hypothetical protein